MTTTTKRATVVGTWNIDSSHSTVEFSARHMMITTVKGGFGGVEGSVRVESDQPLVADVDVRIDAATIDTRTDQRDDHLRSGDFLDVENYPEITFKATRIEGTIGSPGDEITVVGDLTIRGTTREVSLDAIFEGAGQDPWGGERASFTAATRIDRRDFGLTWNQTLETGGLLVGNEVKIQLDVQLVKQES